jgi:Cu(I)/Ag(I) efflux system membrane fusion protein
MLQLGESQYMNKSTLLIAALMLGIGLGVGYWLADSSKPVITSADEKKPLFYRNPMNPGITSPVPAKDPMGMDYVPVYADSEADEIVGTVRIDPVIVQNIGVRTAIAQEQAISRTIRTPGRVDFDEERMAKLHPKVEGWIESIRVDKTGENVAKGDTLLSLYSPQLVSAQQEYLLALNNLSVFAKSPFDEIKQGARDLADSSRTRLRLLDVPEHQIQVLEQTRQIKKSLPVHSPVDGTVIHIGARQGQHVTPWTELYIIVDLRQVWVYIDVYEYELPWIKVGDEAEMILASVPGKIFKGSLAYIYPYAEPKTRTTKVRLVFDNRERLLRPDMFADVTIETDTQNNVIVIPAESVIRSGKHSQVLVVKEPGKFEPRLVKLGIESNGQVAVLSGVSSGEEVVTSAQFLIDSESSLREAMAKMMEATQRPETGLESKYHRNSHHFPL